MRKKGASRETMNNVALNNVALNLDADRELKNGRPVLTLLHGFTQNLNSWDMVRDGLRRIGPTVAVDLIGHGGSPKPEDVAPYRMEACLDHLEAAINRLGLSSCWWVGYSMGGRVALQMAVSKPHLVEGLVLISASAGFPDLEARATRIEADNALADRIGGWGMDQFIDYWLDLPLFEGFKRLPPSFQRAMRAERKKNSPVGLANSLRGMGAGAMLPAWAHLSELTVPALVLAGELDERFVAMARSMAAGMTEADLSIISDVGHSVHLESPQRFLRAVTGYFDRIPRKPPAAAGQ